MNQIEYMELLLKNANIKIVLYYKKLPFRAKIEVKFKREIFYYPFKQLMKTSMKKRFLGRIFAHYEILKTVYRVEKQLIQIVINFDEMLDTTHLITKNTVIKDV